MGPMHRLGGGDFPLGPDDVVLISRGSAAAGLALAQVLACSGATVAVVGREHPDHDEAAVAGLERLRGAGAKVGYELVGLSDHAALTAAVRRIQARFGRVTAISHAAGQVPPAALSQLTPARADELARQHTSPLDQMAAAVRAVARASRAQSSPLRFVVTFGCVTGRYGLAGEGASALVTGAIADYGAAARCGQSRLPRAARRLARLVGRRPGPASRSGRDHGTRRVHRDPARGGFPAAAPAARDRRAERPVRAARPGRRAGAAAGCGRQPRPRVPWRTAGGRPRGSSSGSSCTIRASN